MVWHHAFSVGRPNRIFASGAFAPHHSFSEPFMTGQTSSSRLLHECVRWWRDRMTEILPAALSLKPRKTIRLEIGPDGMLDPDDVAACREELPAPRSGWLPQPRNPDIALVLPQGGILSRDVTLPRVAASNAARTIGYDLDRLTPFRQDDVLWSVQRKPGVERGEQIIFRLLVVPRFLVSAALDTLDRAGISPTCISMDTAADTPLTIPLGKTARKSHPVGRVLALCAAVLVAAPFVSQQITLFRLHHAIAALSDGRTQAEDIRRRIAAFTAAPAALAREEHRIGSPLHIIGTLTDALPDDTFLTAMHIHERHVTMEGESAQATRLIGVLEHDAAFSDAAFSGPVTRSENKQMDVFTINAKAPG